MYRRFATFCLFHLHRRCKEEEFSLELLHAYRQTDSDFNRFYAGMRTRLKKKSTKHLDLFDDRFNDAVTTTTCERTTDSVHKYNRTKRETNWWFQAATLANCLQTSRQGTQFESAVSACRSNGGSNTVNISTISFSQTPRDHASCPILYGLH